MAELYSYPLARIFGYRDKLLNSAKVRRCLGQTLRGEDFSEFVTQIHRLLPKGIPKDLVFDSLQYLAGTRLSERELEDLSWRLAGNLRRLRNLRPVQPWFTQAQQEWVPVQVLSGQPYRTKRYGKPGMIFQLQILAGSPCPLTIDHFWSRGFCRLIASRIGFSAPWGDYPFLSEYQLVSTRLYVLVDPEKSVGGKPGFNQVKETQPGGILSWNKELLKLRARRGGFTCPQNYPAAHRCFQCHVGMDQCPAATHEETFVRKPCRKCQRSNWHDTADDRICVDCNAREALKPQKD